MKKLRIDGCFGEDFIFSEILPKLPVKSLARFKSVSKSWLANISSESFVADHFHRHSAIEKPSQITRAEYRDGIFFCSYLKLFLTDSDYSSPVKIDTSDITKAQSEKITYLSLCGSSYGLVLIRQLYDSKRYNLVLLNPATREFKNLPMPIGNRRKYRGECHVLGFGNDFNNFKVVRIATKVHKGSVIGIEVQLFTRNNGCWRKHGVLSDFKNFRNEGVVVGDFIHWPVLSGENWPANGNQFEILTFDLNSEELKVNNGPMLESDEYKWFELLKWKEYLGAFSVRDDGQSVFWLKNKDTWCWTKILVSEQEYDFKGVFKDQFLLNRFYGDRKDILFDPATKAQTFFLDEFRFRVRLNFQHYHPSLISPSF